ncbi:MAG: 2-amino-4-hydroxy-6-hydroxymethyldihydropteridine diphosphokinase [Pseudomonadota bacterium]
MSFWQPAYIGIGSNLQEPIEQVQRAIQSLAGLADCVGVISSRLYRSLPMGPQDQPDFINAAVGLLTRQSPGALLRTLQGLEAKAGRDRSGERWGPRVLDLDLLFMPGIRRTDESLTLPHAGMAARNFVLMPLCDICPNATPFGSKTVRSLANGAGSEGIETLELGA